MYPHSVIARPTPAVVAAAKFVTEIQDAVNLRAITAAFVPHLDAMRQEGVTGDNLNNHPTVVAFVSKLSSLVRLDTNESPAFDALAKLAEGQEAEYNVYPL